MTREQMLKKMGINDQDFVDYLKKHNAFFTSLNSDQQDFHIRHHGRKVEQIKQSLGQDATTQDVEVLFGQTLSVVGIAPISCCGR
jgi:hypothetical protein